MTLYPIVSEFLTHIVNYVGTTIGRSDPVPYSCNYSETCTVYPGIFAAGECLSIMSTTSRPARSVSV